MAWKFFEAPANATKLSGSHRSAVSRLNLIQDYQEGGQRCQDIKTVARSLYQHQIGCLVAPSNHKGIDIVMSWVNKAYGHLRMGRRLLHSSCDFFALPYETLDHWRMALKAHGTLRGLVRASEPKEIYDAKEIYDRSKRFSELGLTHIVHLLEPDGKLVTWTWIKGLASSKGTQPPYTCREFDAIYSGIPAC